MFNYSVIEGYCQLFISNFWSEGPVSWTNNKEAVGEDQRHSAYKLTATKCT